MTLDELRSYFSARGIDCSTPGFADSQAFFECEKQEPFLLERYAEYIEKLDYNAEYLRRARKIIHCAAKFLFDELVKDGRLGACIDASMCLSKILDREGIWNYMAAGCVRLNYPSESGISESYYQPMMHGANPAKASHAWLVAPPFRVVDITISRQPMSEEKKPYLTGFIIAEKATSKSPDSLKVYDFVEPEVRQEFALLNGIKMTIEHVQQICPEMFRNVAQFGSWEIGHGKMVIRYSTVKIGGGDAPLEKMNNLRLSGRYPIDVYRELKKKLIAEEGTPSGEN